MMMKVLKFALVVAMVVIGYSIWKFQTTHDREIVAYGTVTAKSRTGNTEIVARTRKVRQGPIEFFEVELPSKLWVDCHKDCQDTLRRQVIDIERSIREP